MSLRKKTDTVLTKPKKKEETPKISNSEKVIAQIVDAIGEAKAQLKEAEETIKQKKAELKEIDKDRRTFAGRFYEIDFVEREGRNTLNKDLLINNLVENGLTKNVAEDVVKKSYKKGNPYEEMVVRQR